MAEADWRYRRYLSLLPEQRKSGYNGGWQRGNKPLERAFEILAAQGYNTAQRLAVDNIGGDTTKCFLCARAGHKTAPDRTVFGCVIFTHGDKYIDVEEDNVITAVKPANIPPPTVDDSTECASGTYNYVTTLEVQDPDFFIGLEVLVY